MSKKLSEVKVNSIDVSDSIIEWNLTDYAGSEVSEFKLKSKRTLKTSLVTDLDVGVQVEVWEGFTTATDSKVFNGVISSIEEDGLTFKVTSKDKLWQAVNKTVNKDFDWTVDDSAGVISDIFIDLVTNYAGLSADGTSVQGSGSTFILQKFKCVKADVFEKLQQLADKLNWQFYYRADTDLVYFEPQGFTENPNILYAGGTNNNVVSVPKWKTDMNDLINIVEVDGAIDLYSKTELFSGDGSETDFVLTKMPFSWKVSLDSGAGFVEQTGGKTGSTTGSYAYEMDVREKTIKFTSGNEPPAGADNTKCEYFYGIPANVSRRNDASITAYGEKKTVLTFPDMITVADAEVAARKIIDKFSIPFKSTSIKVKGNVAQNYNLRAGDKVYVVDSFNSISGWFVVNELKKGYPDSFVELSLGDKGWRVADFEAEALKKFKKFEEEMFKNQDLINDFISPSHEFNFSRVSHTITTQNAQDADNMEVGTLNKDYVYDDDHAKILNDLTETTGWSDQGTPSLTIAQDSDVSVLDSTSMKVTWSDTSGTAVLQYTTSVGDLSTITGAASGTPVSGTAGIWVNLNDDTDSISDLVLRIGSSATDYKDYNASLYSLSIHNQWNYYVFDLDNPDGTSGTPDWTAVDFIQLRYTIAVAGSIYLNYLTASVNDSIAVTGVGDRWIEIQQTEASF